MALKGRWGTFVHIPKCAGLPIRKWLRDNLGPGEEVGDFHGLPQLVECCTFAVVREPTTWVRSIWAYRLRSGWEEEKEFAYNWPIIVAMTKWLQKTSWEQFIYSLVYYDFDIPLNIYALYDHPMVKLYRMEELDQLQNDMCIGHPVPHGHVTACKPKVTLAQWAMLRWVCRRSRRKYGYT